MKKIKLVTTIVLLFATTVFSQSFDTFHSNDYRAINGWGAAIDVNNNYYISHYDINYLGGGEYWGGIYKMNALGEIVDSLKMAQLENYSTGMVGVFPLVFENNLYCFGTKNNNLIDATTFYVYKISLELEILDSLVIPINPQFRINIPMSNELCGDKFIVLSSYTDNTLPNSPLVGHGIFMLEVDEDLSDFSYTFSSDNDNSGFAHDFAPMSNGNYLLACFPTWQYNYTGQWNPQSTTLGVFSDSLTPIYTVEMDAFHFWNEIDIDNFQDSLFIISGNKMTHFNPDDTYFGKDLGVYIMDENLNVLDSVEIYTAPYADTTDHTCPQCLDQFDNNTIYFGSTKNFEAPHVSQSNEPNWIRLVKMDANLDIIWEKFYGGDKVNYVTGIKATPDGGCLILCNYYDYEMYPDIYKSDLRYIKVDGNGEVTSVQENLDFQVKSLLMFPNPSDGEVNIDTALRDYEIWFYNHQGQLVYQSPKLSHSQSLDLHHLAQGIYTYAVVDDEGNRLEGGQWVKR